MTKDLDEGQQLHASRLQAWAAYQSGELYLDRAAALNSDLETAKANELLDADQTPEDTDSIRTEIETNVDLALTSFRSSHQADRLLIAAAMAWEFRIACRGSISKRSTVFS